MGLLARAPLVTVILITYNRPALLKESVNALLQQTYTDLEIILINNGAGEKTTEYLEEVKRSDERVSLMRYEENQWSKDDPQKYIRICLNEALGQATGDYVWFNTDDDYIAPDYLEKMVALFQGNPECTTAAGIPVGINIDGSPFESGPRTDNFRPRYMAGHEMILRFLRGDKRIFGAPGYNFTVRRDALRQAGGYHPAIEDGERYGIVPFGVTGFDETAIFYWRRHSGQYHEPLSSSGRIGIEESLSLITDWNLKNRWMTFGPTVAEEVIARLETKACVSAGSWFVRLLYSWQLPGAIRILSKMWRRRQFWVQIPKSAFEPQWIKKLIYVPTKGSAKLSLKILFKVLPGLSRLSPSLYNIKQRIS